MAKVNASLQAKQLAALQKQFGDGSVQSLGAGESRSDVRVVIPTGLDVIDHHVLGCGGWPGGRIVELYGEQTGGKTSLGLAAIASVQRMGGVAHIVETEHALKTERVRELGGDIGGVILHQPDTLEEVFEHMEGIADTLPDETPAVILWDSVAATPTRAEVENGTVPEKEGMAEFARIMSRGLRVMIGKLARTRATLICVNQVRQKVGVVFGNPETTPGGNALKFYASIRLQVGAGTAVKSRGDSGELIGRDALVKCIKNKLAMPFKEARARLEFVKGWNNTWSTLNFAKDAGIVPEGAKPTEANYLLALKELQDPPHNWKVRPEQLAALPVPEAKK